MNADTKLLSGIFNSDVLSANKKTLETFDYYKKTRDLIERTNIALGRNKKFEETSLSTIKTQFNANAIKSTQKI